MGNRKDLAELINMDSPEKVLGEVITIARMMFNDFDAGLLKGVFKDVENLFNGKYPGYRGCNTEYHDFRHTNDVFLATARLLHGVHSAGYTIGQNSVNIALIAALMHDTGYIQRDNDSNGTGAKYTAVHVERSVDFMTGYLMSKGLPEEDIKSCSCIIMSTSLEMRFDEIPFGSPEIKLVGKIHLASDLIGQMADRLYLEKLLFLYKEFMEGNVTGYSSELDLLKKTKGFYEAIYGRVASDADNINIYMKNHFKVRWGIDSDLYREEIEKNLNYLDYVLAHHPEDYRQRLRRGGIVDNLRSSFH